MALTGLFTDSGGSSFTMVAGVLRNTTGSGYVIYSDANHTPLNMGSITTTNSTIVLTYPAKSQMLSFQVTPDETYASMGVFCGASVTTTQAIIWVARYDYPSKKVLRINPKTLVTPLGNFWCFGVFLT